jgi:hypothetical protein
MVSDLVVCKESPKAVRNQPTAGCIRLLKKQFIHSECMWLLIITMDFSKETLDLRSVAGISDPDRIQVPHDVPADVALGLWSCCRGVDPNAAGSGCVSAANHSEYTQQCVQCGLWCDQNQVHQMAPTA